MNKLNAPAKIEIADAIINPPISFSIIVSILFLDSQE